jgi:capsular exopolysaccharide synthesis family protein
MLAEPGQSPLLEGAIDRLLGRLKVTALKNSRIATVSFEAFRPDLAARVANELSKCYIQQTMEFKYEISSEAAKWLSTQIEEQRKKVREAEENLQRVKEKEGIVNIEERRSLLTQKFEDLGSALNGAKANRLQKEALYHQMKNAPIPEELPEVLRDPLVSSLRVNLANLEQQQAQLLERYLDQHPEVVKVRAQIQETRQKIRAEAQRVIRAAETDYRTAAAQEANLANAIEGAKGEVRDLSGRAGDYDTRKKELDAAVEVLNSLLTRQKQTDVAQELKSSNVRIVDPAVVPRGPVRPNRQQDILFGMLLGLGLGVALAFFLEYLDNTIKTPEDIRLHINAPLLGVISEMESKSPGPVLLSPRPTGAFAEGYRVLRTALHYSWPEQGPRVIVVTSTAPGEGKTLTSANLAMTLASADGKVLLIDADLRRPQGHALLKVARRPGLSDVLVGQAKPSDAIQRVGGTNLSVLCSGTHVPSPADLMTTQVLDGLLNGLRDFYNWIVVDSPPVAAVADALIISRCADGVMVVAGAEMVPRSALRHTLERVAETGARVLGVVLNRAQLKRHSYAYGKYYGHYYGHYYGRYPQEVPASRGVANIGDRARR